MNINLKECKLLLNWFDIAEECSDLDDKDLKLHDKIKDFVDDNDDSDNSDPLIFKTNKKKTKVYKDIEEESEEDPELAYYKEDMDIYLDEDDDY